MTYYFSHYIYIYIYKTTTSDHWKEIRQYIKIIYKKICLGIKLIKGTLLCWQALQFH